MKDMVLIDEICKLLKIGDVIGKPELLPYCTNSTNYKVLTSKGLYVIKLLKENINIKREYIKLKEELENKLLSYNIPIRVAKEFNKSRLQYLNNRFFYVYEYIDGNILNSNDVFLDQCCKIGKVLADIHNVEFFSSAKESHSYLYIKWRKYLRLAEYKGSPITDLLAVNIKTLERCTELCNNAINKVPNVKSIVHGDLNCKNVIWRNDEPLIIDLEKINYGNPYVELLETALIWSGIEQGKVNYNVFNNLTKEYFRIIHRPEIDWKIIYDVAYRKRLKETEKYIKKSLMIECSDEEESKLSEAKVEECIKDIVYYTSIKDEILSRLN